jgi:GDP-mannose 6-dehydrogenase
VIGVDICPDKVAVVNRGTSPLVEFGLGELLVEVTAAGLQVTTSTEERVSKSDLALICVGTPSRGNGQLDVNAIRRMGEGMPQARRFRPSASAVSSAELSSLARGVRHLFSRDDHPWTGFQTTRRPAAAKIQ